MKRYPIPAVGAVVKRGDSMLLVRRGKEPSKGIWSIPGGGVKFGETLHQALKREVREETNINVEITELVGVFDHIIKDGKGTLHHYILIDYLAKPLNFDVEAGSDAMEAKWVPFKDLKDFELTEPLRELLSTLFPKF
ncbi:MAG: NUDIX hydrolase [Actinomycetota bacterium]|nr:NUDIX hydrolase [Actinomycetota bacterium]MDI6822228.1 NUDIX hydrolase [Actinomycetota bacterium]